MTMLDTFFGLSHTVDAYRMRHRDAVLYIRRRESGAENKYALTRDATGGDAGGGDTGGLSRSQRADDRRAVTAQPRSI